MKKTKNCSECGYEMQVSAQQCPRCGTSTEILHGVEERLGFFEYYFYNLWDFDEFNLSAPLSRTRFWISIIILSVLYGGALTILLAGEPGAVRIALLGVFLLLCLEQGVELQVRRLKDIHKSGWLVVLSFIPLLNLWPLVLYFFSGSEDIKTVWTKKDTATLFYLIVFVLFFYIIFPQMFANMAGTDPFSTGYYYY